MKTAKRIKRRFSTEWPAITVTINAVKPSGLAFLKNWMESFSVTDAVKDMSLQPVQQDNKPFPPVIVYKDILLVPEDPEVRKMVEDAIKPKPTTVRIGVIGDTEDFEHTAKINLRSPYESC